MKRVPIFVGLLLFVFSAYATQPADTPQKPDVRRTTRTAIPQRGKPVWQFTDDERIALRTNATLAQQRVAESRQSRATTNIHDASAHGQPLADSLDGTHAELFLPFEVFSEFVNLGFDPRSRDTFRHFSAAEVRAAGLPPDFWARIDALIAFHVADVRTERGLLESRSKLSGPARERVVKALELKRADVCRGRAEALAAARKAFGRDHFDRFLYEYVAINMFQVADRLPTAEQLRHWEGGCQ
jgi:hypothetical protein